MFAKDYHLLNEIYNQKVIQELNLGPQGDMSPEEGLSPTKVTIPAIKKCTKCQGPDEECEGMMHDENSNTDMAKQSLFRLFKLSAMLHDLLSKEEDVEPWILAKITESLSNIESAFGYKDYEKFRHQVESDIMNIKEETERDLYDTIATGGTNIVNKIRDVLTNESQDTLERVVYETITVLERKKAKA